MQEDDSGFLYPHVDVEACVDCHRCEQVCPCLNDAETPNGQPVEALAAMTADEATRMVSSSGGVFSLLAGDVIAQGGVVFGARFDGNWHVVHDVADSIDGLDALRGSKYVQSVIGDNFCKAEGLLKQGRKVLFSGTPCQIAGLRLFLGKEYDNLLLVEVACHGVPSPKVWRQYLGEASLSRVNFRDKSTGWKNYSVVIGAVSRPHDDDEFMGCFLKNYTLRPSCFDCRFKAGQSGADITLADFWGIQTIVPHLDDNKGTSLVIVNTAKGSEWMARCPIERETVNYGDTVKANPSIVHSATRPGDYEAFWQALDDMGTRRALKKYGKLYPTGLLYRLKRVLSRLLNMGARH